MQAIKLMVTGAQALVTQAPTATSGMVGLPVELNFDAQWDDLKKTLVFKAGPVSRVQLEVGEKTVVPWEVLAQPGHTLRIGVCGTDAQGTVIPTVWATVGLIQEGATPSGDPGMDPQLPVWQQLCDRVSALEATETMALEKLGYFWFSGLSGHRAGDERISFVRPDGGEAGWDEFENGNQIFISLPDTLRKLLANCKNKKALWVKIQVGTQGYEEIIPAVYNSEFSVAGISESLRLMYPFPGGYDACGISISADDMVGPMAILDMFWYHNIYVEVYGL